MIDKLTNFGDPEFNSGISYLQRIGMLMTAAHINATNDDDYKDWYNVLNQLLIELAPRIGNAEETKRNGEKVLVMDELLRLKRDARNCNYEAVFNYHLKLNAVAHSLKLIMRDADTRLAAEIER